METDVKGKVRNTTLSPNRASLPLFECIINSIQAIDEAQEENGYIEIIIDRDEDSIDYDDAKQLEYNAPVKDITIIDNGVGFNEINFTSFNKAETTHKMNKGSKGVGRFIWLKSFNKVKVSSNFRLNGSYQKRDFDFLLTPSGVENHNLLSSLKSERKTTVKLLGFKETYCKFFPRDIEDIVLQILEHCIIYLVSGNCPIINVIDKKTGKSLSVNDYYLRNTTGSLHKEPIKLKGEDFTLNIIELTNTTRKPKLHFCANSREVESYRLTDRIPELSQKIYDENDNQIVIRGYLTGEYLNSIANSERTIFAFPKDDELFSGSLITEQELIDESLKIIKEKYEDLLSPLKDVKIETYTRFIKNEAPQFKTVLKYKKSKFDSLKPGLNKKNLEVELFKINQDIELDVKKESNQVFEKIKNVEDFEEYQELYDNFIDKVLDVGSSKLSQYIIHRKAILELFEKQLGFNDEDKYALENSIHKIIFPLRKISDEINHENQNLWMLDERLSYHKYLASDVPLKKVSEIESESLDRPDLLIFNEPFAFVNDSEPYKSVVLVEFKRPMRNNFPKDEKNPLEQVYGYIEEIIAGRKIDKNGRALTGINENTPFYCYIVCDITPKIKSFAKSGGLTLTPDSLGFFGYNSNYNTYIEIISFTKLVKDAKERNQFLFDKLNL